MMARWKSLQPREQLVLALGIPAAVLLLGWALLWQPLAKSESELRSRVATLSDDLAWMRQAAAQLGSDLPGNTTTASLGGSALSAVETGLTAARLHAGLKQLSPVGEGRVRVVLEGVAFDPLLDWLEQLERDYGLQAEEFSARQVAPGAADITLVLRPGAP